MTSLRRLPVRGVVVVGLAALVVALVITTVMRRGDSPRHSTRTESAEAHDGTETTSERVVPPASATAPAPPKAPSAGGRPVRLQIPSIKVDSTLERLGVTRSGALQTPSRWQRAGWYADGIRPGDVGPAVIAGHVDSRAGPAVFFRLSHLRAGAHVTITRADGARLTFVVDGAHEYPKKTFPTEAVYGPTSVPALRLITCTGDFDYAKRSYVDNLVVTSHLLEP